MYKTMGSHRCLQLQFNTTGFILVFSLSTSVIPFNSEKPGFHYLQCIVYLVIFLTNLWCSQQMPFSPHSGSTFYARPPSPPLVWVTSSFWPGSDTPTTSCCPSPQIPSLLCLGLDTSSQTWRVLNFDRYSQIAFEKDYANLFPSTVHLFPHKLATLDSKHFSHY